MRPLRNLTAEDLGLELFCNRVAEQHSADLEVARDTASLRERVTGNRVVPCEPGSSSENAKNPGPSFCGAEPRKEVSRLQDALPGAVQAIERTGGRVWMNASTHDSVGTKNGEGSGGTLAPDKLAPESESASVAEMQPAPYQSSESGCDQYQTDMEWELMREARDERER